tara:strand:- start:297 stop:1046 length:750 start_codon:yes stop_codon:yes gene_type:complete
MAPSNESVYQPERISKISRIMPQFAKVAEVGDTVMMGLEGDPANPWTDSASRPMATIVDKASQVDGTSVKLRMDDGTERTVNEYSIAPGDVWEFTDVSFAKVMERERAAQARAEEPIVPDSAYRGDASIVDELRHEIQNLKAELDAEKRSVRSFQNTYIMTMKELANDVMKLDTKGDCANFCRTFSSEYEKMRTRAEESIYRGTNSQTKSHDNTALFADEEEEESEEEFSEESEEEYETAQQLAMSDFF